MKHTILLGALLALAACNTEQVEVSSAPAFNIDAQRITVSGVSSGAYMAGQLHVAHSALFSGAALLAGGPYRCAAGNIQKALGACISGGDIDEPGLLEYARTAADAGQIDSLENLAHDPVWLFHAANDAVVSAEMTQAAASFYSHFTAADSIVVVSDVAAVHGMPTLETGVACDTMAAPFLNACDYDAAGELLRALYGELQGRVAASGQLVPVTLPDAASASMLEEALLYVPTACGTGASCGLHVALHGCNQSVEKVGDAFARGAGYNEWAESNNLLVLYPQVASSKLMPMNPLGCWDWWGYTSEDYANQNGAQVRAIKSLLDKLAGRTL